MMKKIIAIDPGTRNCGYSIFNDTNLNILEYGLFSSNNKNKYTELNKMNWLNNCKNIISNIEDMYYKTNFYKLILEYPEYWSGSSGYAARESGSIFKLTFLCGGIYFTFCNMCKVVLVTPSQWKGQLKKDTVKRRLEKIYPELKKKKINHNTMDAIGIGYYTLKEKKK